MSARIQIQINASEVAALIGENRFVSTEDAFIRLWKRNDENSYYNAVKSIETLELFEEREQHFEDLGKLGNLGKLGKEKEKFKEDLIEATSKDAYYNGRTIGALKRLEAKIEDIGSRDAVRKYIFTTIGKTLENKSLDAYERESNTKVVERNEKRYSTMISDNVNIVGRVDGIDKVNHLVIEHKQRQHKLSEKVSSHEMIQLIVYMKLAGYRKARLVESYRRSLWYTTIEWPGNDYWNDIKSKLLEQVNQVNQVIADWS